jgi:quercetin dioxygenase-like cupin family protein
MPHELEGQVHWHEPAGLSPAGLRRFRVPASPYERFIADEALPVLRAASVDDPRAVALADWRRLGGRGAYLQLHGAEGALGQSLLEIPASDATRAERHLCDEIVFVLSGSGTTSLQGADGRIVFEWQQGALFAIPRNATHRMINATDRPALLLCLNTLPAALDLLGDADAVLANPLPAFLDEEAGQAFDGVEPDPVQGLALCRTGMVPDAANCDLPLDNRVSPAHRAMALGMTGPAMQASLGEHRPGRYGRARLTFPGEIRLCLRGGGEIAMWREEFGPSPAVEHILRFPQRAGVLTGLGGGEGRWFVQEFCHSPGPMRHLLVRRTQADHAAPGSERHDPLTTAWDEGGAIVPYWREAPGIRAAFAEAVAARGVACRMRAEDYAESGADE